MEQYYFVYGTLKKGYSNHRLLNKDGAEFIANVETKPEYTLFDGNFPIVERGGTTSIKGELYKVSNPNIIRTLDALEGYSGEPGHPDNWYDLERVELSNGVTANMYVMNEGESNRTKIIKDGLWKR